MKMEHIREIADAVLYEGYLLYPYRRSSIKNQQRWTFGVVYPQEYSVVQGETEPWTMRTECLMTGDEATTLDITLRFLHLLICAAPPSFETWEEGVEREVSAPSLTLGTLLTEPLRIAIEFPSARIEEHEPRESSAAAVTREHRGVVGALVIAAEPVEAPALADRSRVYKLSVQIENTTPNTGSVSERRNTVLPYAFVSTHTILTVHEGAFVSLLDPPEALKDAVKQCQNSHTWPVLIGDEGDTDAMLSSPIILYDYPQIAPESPGPLFDGTEIDEILLLRILTLTDEEKEEMRQGDERAREILERTESMTPDDFMKLHGVIRGLRAVDEGGPA